MKLAFLFPGQGSQAVGMGQKLAEVFPAARDAFAEADDVLGFALTDIMWSGPEETLKRTENAQPALLVHSIAALRVATEKGLKPAPTDVSITRCPGFSRPSSSAVPSASGIVAAVVLP